MFFIFGIHTDEKQLDFAQQAVCSCCGRLGRVEIVMTYSVFSLFFLPIFKWSKRYYVRMGCCGASCELEETLGRQVERGALQELPPEALAGLRKRENGRRCAACGAVISAEFTYCPHCGERL